MNSKNHPIIAKANNTRKPKGNWFYFFFKRVFDIVASLLGLILIWWIMLIVAIAVKCNSKGPVIFADRRVGKNGKIIKVFKFRSMFIDAEANIDSYLSPEQKEQWLKERKLENDPRITKVGRFIRKTSLDELPQLFNIFGGSMSVVGTRPITIRELEDSFTKDEQQILKSGKPGLTGYWQVYGRGEAEYCTGERQKLELEYFYRRSLAFDLKLIFLTIPAVLKHKGAK